MSKSFEVFPTKKKKLRCKEIVDYSLQLFREFLEKEKLSQPIYIDTKEVTSNSKECTNPVFLTQDERHLTVLNNL